MGACVAPTPPKSADLATTLRRFVEAYWLRPENAFWMALRSETLATASLRRPFIDIGCGDGVFGFLHLGGRFDPSFDVFEATRSSDCPEQGRVDMFDHFDERYEPPVLHEPTDRIDVGLDLKSALLAKATKLNLFDRLIEHDCNDPLPLEPESFQTVYCNAAYWVKNIEGFLREMRRVTRADGVIILQVKLAAMRDFTLNRFRKQLGDTLLGMIDRGRMDCWPSLADRQEWERRFSAAGLAVESATPFITATHAHIWDIGLRPIAPMLVKMANALTPQTRASIKKEWVDLFCELLTPICDPNFDLLAGKNEPAEIQYVLRPA